MIQQNCHSWHVLWLLACCFPACALFLPGNLAWANFDHFLYLSGIFSLHRDQFLVKGQALFCVCCLPTWALAVLDLLHTEIFQTTGEWAHSVAVYLTHMMPGATGSIGYAPHALCSYLRPVKSSWHI